MGAVHPSPRGLPAQLHQMGLPYIVAHAYAAELRLDDASRPGAAVDEAGFGKLEAEAMTGRQQVRDIIVALGVNPEMLVKVLS